MNYKPDALDVDKMEKMFDLLCKESGQVELLERTRLEYYHKGYKKAIDDCRCSLSCSNYEIKFNDSAEIIRTVFYEICKELDMKGSDIYDAGLSIDETASKLAERIREQFWGSK